MARKKYAAKKETKQEKMNPAAENKKEEKGLDTTVHDIAKLDFAMQDAMEDAGMEAKTYGFWGPLWRLLKKRDERVRHAVNKKKYIRLCIFTGWFGGHRFYAKRYYLGAIYLVFFWTCIPLMMALLDFMEVFPMQADEDGNVMM